MKRTIFNKIFFIAAGLMTLAACGLETSDPDASLDGDKVTVSLSISAPEGGVVTKALGETHSIASDGLFVAVYENGYRCEVAQAEEITGPDASGKYTFSLSLTKTDKPRDLHFISTSGFSASKVPFEETALGTLCSEGGNDAYWCRKHLNQVAEDLQIKGELGEIVLVRNFAKLTLEVDENCKNFVLESFKVFNTPGKGYIAPYYDGEFIDDYLSEPDFEDLVELYPGRIPSDADLIEYNDEVTFIPVGNCDYFYERPVPASNPAYIIVKGKYYKNGKTSGETGKDFYYKINLRDSAGNYYALLRNFNYSVDIMEVHMEGYTDPDDAIASPGSGDIMTAIEYENVNNISDAVGQMFVSETSYTVVGATDIKVKYKFITDITQGDDAVNNTKVYGDELVGVQIIVEDGDAIESVSDPVLDSNDNYSAVTVKTKASDVYKEQKITFKGCYLGKDKYGNDTYKYVQRTVTIIVRPTLLLCCECPATIDNSKGAELPLTIGLEDNLPESIFPIPLKIQVTALSLVPATGENLVVENGKSFDGLNKPIFYYVKSLSYEEYEAATAADYSINGNTVSMKQIVCNFLSNMDESDSSIYVTSDLFNADNCSFETAEFKHFNLKINNSTAPTVVLGANKTATISFEVDSAIPVNVVLSGATYNGQSTFTYTPSAAGTIDLTINLSSYGGAVGVSLSAEGYARNTVKVTRTFTIVSSKVSSLFVRMLNFTAVKDTFTSNTTIGFPMHIETADGKSIKTFDISITRSGTSSNRTYKISGPTSNVVVSIPESISLNSSDVIKFWFTAGGTRYTASVTAATLLSSGTVSALSFSAN